MNSGNATQRESPFCTIRWQFSVCFCCGYILYNRWIVLAVVQSGIVDTKWNLVYRRLTNHHHPIVLVFLFPFLFLPRRLLFIFFRELLCVLVSERSKIVSSNHQISGPERSGGAMRWLNVVYQTLFVVGRFIRQLLRGYPARPSNLTLPAIFIAVLLKVQNRPKTQGGKHCGIKMNQDLNSGNAHGSKPYPKLGLFNLTIYRPNKPNYENLTPLDFRRGCCVKNKYTMRTTTTNSHTLFLVRLLCNHTVCSMWPLSSIGQRPTRHNSVIVTDAQYQIASPLHIFSRHMKDKKMLRSKLRAKSSNCYGKISWRKRR